MRVSLRTFLPKSFWGRSVAIVLMPIFLIQVASVYIFFGRHWETITRTFSQGMVRRLVTGTYLFESSKKPVSEKISLIERKLGLSVAYQKRLGHKPPRGYHVFQSRFERALNLLMPYPYYLLMGRDVTRVWVCLDAGVLVFAFPTKLLLSKTSLWWFLWSFATAVFFAFIAAFFMWRQLVPLKRLSHLALKIERGEDITDYFARGAREFRQIGHALVFIYRKWLQKNKEQTEMLMALSHDLRTPLARMKLQLALMDNKKSEIMSLKEDIAQMDDMVTSYMAFMETGSLDAPSHVVILDLVFRVLKSLNAKEQKHITLDVPRGYRLFVGRHALERCIQNLFENALFYAKDKIHFSVVEREGWVYITVEDDGPGVPDNQKDAIFEPFVRLGLGRSLEKASTGLGLSIVRNFVHSLGGAVRALSSPMGGLRIEIRLKLMDHVTSCAS